MRRPLLILPLVFVAGASAQIFTAAQADAGRALYAQSCAGCHGANFEGSGDAPPLSGSTFLLKWRPRMVSELFGEILQNMPTTNPGSLGEGASLAATAFILQRNGAQAGGRALTPGATNLIGAIATGQGRGGTGRGGQAGAVPLIVMGAGSATAATRGGTLPTLTYGVTAPGEVKNYVPVTAGDAQESAARGLADLRTQLSTAQL